MTLAEIQRFLEELRVVHDDRNPPDSNRQGQFRTGWEDATVRNQDYRKETLQRLTWHNLGYRFGKRFGSETPEQIDQIYGLLVQLYEGIREDGLSCLPGEIPESRRLYEGAVCRVTVNAHERNREAVKQCKNIHGTNCVICGFDFGAMYGAEFENFIHVHHLQPLSESEGERQVKPETDLAPVCPNCHSVIHYGSRFRSLEEVKSLLADNSR